MKIVKTEKFEFEDKNYETRVYFDGFKYLIRVYLKDKPANIYEYIVKVPDIANIEKAFGVDALEHYVKKAKDDVIEKRYEKYRKALAKVKERHGETLKKLAK
jgi:hypothetical protein